MAFGWFKNKAKRTPSEEEARQTIEAVQTVVSAYGALLEQHPAEILDASRLPLSKAEMKDVLKIAWRLSTTDSERNAIEVGYVNLSEFQEGIGDKPINLLVPPNADPAKVLEVLNPSAMEWRQKSLDEMGALLAELNEFKRTHSKS